MSLNRCIIDTHSMFGRITTILSHRAPRTPLSPLAGVSLTSPAFNNTQSTQVRYRNQLAPRRSKFRKSQKGFPVGVRVSYYTSNAALTPGSPRRVYQGNDRGYWRIRPAYPRTTPSLSCHPHFMPRRSQAQDQNSQGRQSLPARLPRRARRHKGQRNAYGKGKGFVRVLGMQGAYRPCHL